MNQEELRLHRCCFTGHRPEKMELGEKEIKSLLEKAIDEAIARWICNLYNRHGDGNGYMGSGDCVGEKENEQGLASYMCFATSEF